MTPREPDLMTQKFRESQARQRQAIAEFRRAAVKLASALIELDVGPLTLEERERIKQYVNDQAHCIIELEKTL